MARYAWPHDTRLHDDGFGRRGYNDDLFPPPDFRFPDGLFPPVGDPPPDPPPVGADLWLPLGPSVVLGGQASGGPRVAGRVRDLVIEPTDGFRLYAATGSGGVWYSGSRGISWEPLDNFAASPNRNTQTPVGNSLSCGAIHVLWGAADDGSQDVVTVGTGEIFRRFRTGAPGATLAGVGVLRATGPATGANWTREAVVAPNDLRGHGFYRIVQDPGDATLLLAATTRGLVARSADAWAVAAFDGTILVDVAVTRHTDPARTRVWVARFGQLHVAESTSPTINLASLTFNPVTLPNVLSTTRLRLAVGADSGNLWVLGRRTPLGTATFNPAHLWHVDGAMDLTSGTPTATEVTGVPPELFGSTDQSGYDMTITAHPTVDDRLWVGGSTELFDGQWNASIHRIFVTRPSSGSTFAGAATAVGRGIHADVHALRTAPSPSPGDEVSVWVGCDGGVFLSDRDGDLNSYFARNTGMATLEPGFVASHPTNDGIVAAGMQDNGVCVRSGDTIWVQPFKGDGGGLVFDPTHPNRFINQYIRATWRFSGSDSKPPVERRQLRANSGTTQNSQQVESAQSAFYSGADAVAHGGTTHLALGSNRVWYSDNWGTSWVTIPTGTDPRADLSTNLAQDVLFRTPGGAGTSFSDTDRSFLCCTSTEAGTSPAGSSILTVKWGARSAQGGRDRIRLGVLVNDGSNSALVLVEGSRSTGASGAWSWDATLKRRPIRAINSGVVAEQTDVDAGTPTVFLPAPGLVNDIAVHDPELGADGSFYITTVGAAGSGAGQEIDTLWWYDGAGTFRPTGLRRALTPDQWSPTTARITAPAHAVIVDPSDRKTVYVGTSVGVVTGTFSSEPAPNWTWRRFDNNLPEAVVHDLSIYRHDGQHLLRAALGARGIWEVDLTRAASPRNYLRLFPTDTRRRLPTPLEGPTTNGSPSALRWDASPDVIVDRTSFTYPGGPLEPALLDIPQGRAGRRSSIEVSETTMRVHVLVHHRWHAPAEPTALRVALLRHDIADDGTVPVGGIWATLVAISGGGAVPATLPDGWAAAGGDLIRPIAQAATARTPRAATFDVDLSPVAGRDLVLLAVVFSDADPISLEDARFEGADAITVEELVTRSRHTAGRSIRGG